MVNTRLKAGRSRAFPYYLIAAAVALFAGLAACTAPATTSSSSTGSGSTAAAAAGSGNITVGLAAAPDALDPTTGSTFDGRTVFANMCQKLYDINAQLNVGPQLATSLPVISDGGLTYTIQLKQGVLFNDGTSFNAAAVKTTLEHYLTDPESARAAELHGLQSVDVTGPYTVVLHLSKPFAPL
ncbi:MAG: peptide/nickel transport system substrate-binding protein, partial [Trebonia sp.]|nr:peptide/nickel transport system substrate-binding protein [Trebonia sp.]